MEHPPGLDERTPRATALAALGLFLFAFVLYLGARENGFLHYDDDTYVRQNEHVVPGLSGAGIGWALTNTTYACNWHPLTWMSHMLDMTLFGRSAAGHHLSSVLLHALSSALAFLALAALTRSFRASLWVAALFACHPVRVESVAWVAERKDVLAGLFFWATLLAWARWVRSPAPARYALALVLFVLALASKPMAVTLPCVLLLLDRWPLERTQGWGTLLREKLPFFALSLGSALVTFHAQSAGGCTRFIAEGVSLAARAGNAAIAYVQYARLTLWPVDLAVFYPHPAVVAPEVSRVLPAVGALLGLALVTLLCVRLRRRSPALLVGWLWFLGTLVPVLGVVQVGGQALAGRYAYLPTVGLYLMLVFGAAPYLDRHRRAATVALTLVVLGLALMTAREIRYWRDDRTLFERALEVTERNYVAHINLGRISDDPDEAFSHFRAAARICPTSYEARVNLGWAHALRDEFEPAEEHLRQALELRPDEADAHFKYALVQADLGDHRAAARELEETLRLDPDHPSAAEILLRMRAEQQP